MFAYCLNNPIRIGDFTGMRAVVVCVAQHLGNGGGPQPAPVSPIAKFTTKVTEIMKNVVEYVTNDDEQKALDSGPISFYKGAPVVHLPFDVDPFSVGIIFLGSETQNWDNAVETIQHEYGHSVHLSQIGLSAYLSTVAVPSVIGHTFVKYDQYYSQPWECIADIFGGVITRTDSYGQPYQYSANAWLLGLYWTYTYILP